jgi:phosphoribosylanthranilate isomerase
MSTRVKFCGCMTWADVSLAIDEGADAFGMIFASGSRTIDWNAVAEIAQHLPAGITPVGVFVNPSLDEIERARWNLPNLVIQLSGDESPEFTQAVGGPVIKAIHVRPDDTTDTLSIACDAYAPALPLFDTHANGAWGGTGNVFDWQKVVPLARERSIVVAGGLTPENVGACVRLVHPAWVDVRSGIETNGRKDASKMARFIEQVREANGAH